VIKPIASFGVMVKIKRSSEEALFVLPLKDLLPNTNQEDHKSCKDWYAICSFANDGMCGTWLIRSDINNETKTLILRIQRLFSPEICYNKRWVFLRFNLTLKAQEGVTNIDLKRLFLIKLNESSNLISFRGRII
jgi:hypothetical protein